MDSVIKNKILTDRPLAELVEMVGGKLVGDGETVIRGVAPVQNAGPAELTFLERADRIQLLKNCRAGAAVVPEDVLSEKLPESMSAIRVPNVLEAFKKIAFHFSPPRDESVKGISDRACIHQSVLLGSNVAVAPFAVIEEDVELGDGVTVHAGVQIRAGTKIGDGSTIFANAVLYRNTVIGRRCIIHSGAVIGAYGFGYDSSDGVHKLSPQMGNVVVGDDVEIGSCSTIDRATYGSTLIGDGTKIDNLVMIGHNCKIGRFNLICAHTGIAGSTTTGDHVVMAGRGGIRDHVHIGDRAVLGAMAGIMANVSDDARVVGIPATPEKEQMKLQVNLARLPEMRKQFKELVKQVEQLKARMEAAEVER